MKIIVDGFGGDNAPGETIKGCRQAVDEYGVESYYDRERKGTAGGCGRQME